MMAEQRAQFTALKASYEVTPAVMALFETLLSMLQMLVLLEKKQENLGCLRASQPRELPLHWAPIIQPLA